MKNKEKTKKDWLIYSPSKGVVYCYVCKLFSSSRQSLCEEGFGNWKNISERLSEHESSKTHRDVVCTLSLRSILYVRFDFQFVDDYQT